MDIEYMPGVNVLLIHGHEPDVVATMREQVVRLASKQIDVVALHTLPGFRSIDGCQLFLQHDISDHGTHLDKEPRLFRCHLRPITWHNIEGLLEPFSDGRFFGTNHQDLDENSEIRLIISGQRGW